MKEHVDRSGRSLLIRSCLGMLLLAAGSSLSACYIYTTPYHEVHYAEGGEVVADEHGTRCLSCHHDAPSDGVFVEVTREGR